METNHTPLEKLDKSAYSIANNFDHADDDAYWLSRTPQERLQHMQRLRWINYGPKAAERLQRVLEIAQQPER